MESKTEIDFPQAKPTSDTVIYRAFGYMGELRAVIFDVDGTLADTERDGHRVAFNRVVSQIF